MRLTGYPVFFLTVSQLKKSGGLNNPKYELHLVLSKIWEILRILKVLAIHITPENILIKSLYDNVISTCLTCISHETIVVDASGFDDLLGSCMSYSFSSSLVLQIWWNDMLHWVLNVPVYALRTIFILWEKNLIMKASVIQYSVMK